MNGCIHNGCMVCSQSNMATQQNMAAQQAMQSSPGLSGAQMNQFQMNQFQTQHLMPHQHLTNRIAELEKELADLKASLKKLAE